MSWRWHLLSCFSCLMLLLSASVAASEEPGAGYVPDPEIEKVIDSALNTDKAIAYPAMKRLIELGGAGERALNYRLFNDKTPVGRRALGELLARCGTGRTGYRVTLELAADGSGRLLLESDRTMIAECARKFDRINEKPVRDITEDELRRNPYSKTDLAKHIENSVLYTQGDCVAKEGRIVASGEVTFGNFDDLAGFANSFDRTGYFMLNGISLSDANGMRVLRVLKPAESDPKRAANYLALFHDLKWEFVLEFKGAVKAHNATRVQGNRLMWRFNCAQMLNGESEIEVSFDPKALPAPSHTPAPARADGSATQPASEVAAPKAVPASKQLSIKVAERPQVGQPNPNGPETILVLDGSASVPRLPELQYQWNQTGGRPLYLGKEKLAMPVVKMRVYEVGRYTFELTVSYNGVVSDPVEVAVVVGDGGEIAAGDSNATEGSNLYKKHDVLPPLRNKKTNPEQTQSDEQALPKQAPLNPIAPPPVAQEQPALPPTPPQNPGGIKNDPPEPAPITVKNQLKPNPMPLGKGILLDEIRQEEAEYYSRVAAANGGASKKVAVSTEPPRRTNENPPDATQRNIDPPAVVRPKNTPELENQGHGVATTSRRIDLEAIRQEEAIYNKARPVAITPATSVQPVATPVPPAKENPPKFSVQPPTPDSSASPGDKNIKSVEKQVSTANNELREFQSRIDKATAAESPKTPAVPAIPPRDSVPPVVTTTVPTPVEKKQDAPLVAKSEERKVENPATSKVPDAPVANTASAAGGAGQGLQLIKAGNYKGAIEVLTKATQAAPKDADLRMQLAVAMFEAAEWDRVGVLAALDKFVEAINANEENAEAFMYAGHCNTRVDRLREAAEFYRRGYQLGKDKVSWEPKWQLGAKYLKNQEFAEALKVLSLAEEAANAAGVKNARLLRDMAVALHGVGKDDEAAKHLNALSELGYTPDAKLVAELQKGGTAPAAKPPEGTAAKQTTESTAPAKPTENVVKVEPTKAAEKVPAVPEKTLANAANQLVGTIGLTNPPAPERTQAVTPPAPITSPAPAIVAPPPPVAVTPPVTPPPTPPAAKKVTDLEKIKADSVNPSPRPPKPTAVEPVKETAPVVEPPRARKPLPPVPAKFEDAMAAGIQALQRGAKLIEAAPPGEKKDAARKLAQDDLNEAEAMLRGAWDMKPEDPEVLAQFEELAKQVGVIALARVTHLTSKPKGLVRLDAQPSLVFPKEKTLYYAWDQVEGKDLGLRSEDLNSKLIGLKIKDPGIYKFELTVSDGARGANPVTVTVEVRE